jgi:D-alanyl-D-alanine carboxypeptidase/D-alanyl-D-alanine-endopeptidase (penicillin-binding protein 4)
LKFRLAFVFLLSFTFSSLATAASLEEKLRDAVRKSGLPEKSLSLLAVSGSGKNTKTHLSHNAHTALIPASVMKLITAAVALQELPPGTRFRTRLLSDGRIEGNRLMGDLVLKGGGDPSFVSETLWVLVSEFSRTGIREIQGDIVVDDSFFDSVRIDPGRDVDRVDLPYDAPVGAMSFNWNSVAIFIRPGERVGEPARVMTDPASDYMLVRGEIKTVPGRVGADRIRLNRHDDPAFFGNILDVGGSYGQQSGEFVTYRNITRPDLWSGANLALYLRYLGIRVTGKVRAGLASDRARLLAQAEGRPVEQIVVDMNKVSSNYIAEMLTKSISAHRDAPGTMQGGLAVMRDYLDLLDVKSQEYALNSPSGLSRSSRLSANALVSVLQDMGNNFQFETEFMASLPIAGVDGTLRKRMRKSAARGWVRAKTGYIDGAITLAGYAGREDGGRVSFAFLYNGYSPGYKVQKLYEQLCSLLVTED